MNCTKKTGLALVLAFAALTSGLTGAFAADKTEIHAALEDTAAYVQRTVTSPQVGSIGGEWAVLGLARSGVSVPQRYYDTYYNAVADYVKSHKGVLDDRKYTEYSRVTVALSAIGADPTNVGGYNLLLPLGDYEKTIWQGMNGPIWALIALDSGNYEIPQNKDAKTQATRDLYIKQILDCQLSDGGWSLFGGTEASASGDDKSDPDITGMALQALAKYQNRADVKKATDEALACMSKQQDAEGGYSSWSTANVESCVQMVVALGELGIPVEDSRFVKNGKSMADNLLSFYKKGEGFLHTHSGEGANGMATEQGFYALVSLNRAANGKQSLYRMSDTTIKAGQSADEAAGKDSVTAKVPAAGTAKSFPDTQSHANREAILDLASRAVISGETDGNFYPDRTMTRAEFATIIVKALGLTPKANHTFSDVPADEWYASFVGTANTNGIVSGVSATAFAPNNTITRQEAAAMVSRAAKLCGMDTAVGETEARDMLAQFPDYVTSDAWSRPSLAFCYREGILSQDDAEIRPQDAILRCEVAQMLYNMLTGAKLV